MGIKISDHGFYEWHDNLSYGPGLGITSDRIDECIDHFHRQQFVGWFGHKSFGFNQDQLNLLCETPSAKWLWLWDAELRDIDGVYQLTDVEYFGVNNKRPGINFARLKSLNTVVNHWNRKDHGLSASTITDYFLWHYKPRNKSFAGLEIPSGVRKLEFNWANPLSLAEFPVLPDLERLQFHYCRNLTDLSELARVAPNLKYLTASRCRKIDVSELDSHPMLESAYINDEVIVDRVKRGS